MNKETQTLEVTEEQEKKLVGLLWCYATPISDTLEEEKIKKLKEYLKKEKIPLTTLKHLFKVKDPEIHLRVIYAATKIVVRSSIHWKKEKFAS